MQLLGAAANSPVIRGRIGIATVLYNSSPVLEDFLRSLGQQTYRNFTVYAVDNASGDDSVLLCRSAGNNIVVIPNAENAGFAVGTNQGIIRALEDGCEFIFLLNNDVSFRPDFFESLIAGIERTAADIVTPITYYFDPPNTIWAAGAKLQKWIGYRPVHIGMGEEDRGQFLRDQKIDFAPGAAVFARRSVFTRVGLLDEAFYTYWEDTDFAVRALKAGLRTYLIPSAKLWHKVSSLTGVGSPFQRFYSVRNHALYIAKHCSLLEKIVLTQLYLTGYRVYGLLRGKKDERIAVWKQGIEVARKHGY